MNEKDREVMQQALEALKVAAAELDSPYTSETSEERILRAAITALRIVLEQVEPVQEPVGQVLHDWSTEQECISGTWACLNDLGKNLPVGTKLYARPPQREQVLLTDEEIDRIHLHLSSTVGSSYKTVARTVEKASWEKNK